MAVFPALAGRLSPLVVGATLVSLCIVSLAVQKYLTYRRLSHFKGPFWAAWTELWLARVTWLSRIHTELRDVNEK